MKIINTMKDLYLQISVEIEFSLKVLFVFSVIVDLFRPYGIFLHQ